MNLQQSWPVSSLDELPEAARALLDWCSKHCPRARKFATYGEMGAGKTTLITEVCRHLGVTVDTSSPTFAIVNEYPTPEERIFHLDLYRLENAAELADMGFENYMDGTEYTFIEWPQLAEHWFDEDVARIDIVGLEDGSREISLTAKAYAIPPRSK